MPTYTFQCCEKFDRRASYGDTTYPCPTCGKTAQRVSVYRIGFGGFARTPAGERDYRQSFKDAQEAGAELEYRHERLKDAVQDANLAPPPLYQMAKAKAMDLKRKGAVDASDLS